MSVLIVDYGMCNIGSVRRAFNECGADVVVSDSASDIPEADSLVLPGVGSFYEGIKRLKEGGLAEALIQATQGGTPLLGICLGMQLLATKGHEGGLSRGLGIIPGEVVKLKPESADVRLPHVGWNEIKIERTSPLLNEIKENTDFYFTHSYHFVPKRDEDTITRTPYCGGFVSAVMAGNVAGVQFHPEKSHRPGLRLILNYLRLASA